VSRLETSIRTQVNNLLTLSEQKGPPINLRLLLPHRHVIRAYPANLGQKKAQLVPVEGGFVIRYRNMGGSVNRFSIAHEIGHTYYYNLETSPPSKLGVPAIGIADEERFCDLFAAELLMPAQFVSNEALTACSQPPYCPSTEALIKIAKKFNVSTRVAARRLIRDLAIWDAIALCCQWLNRPTSRDVKSRDNWAWRGIWGYKPERYGKNLYLPPFRNLPRIHLDALNDTYEKYFRKGTPSTKQYKEPISNLKLGNLDTFLRHQGYTKEYTVSVSWINLDRDSWDSYIDDHFFSSGDSTDMKGSCRILVIIPLGSYPVTSSQNLIQS